MSKSTQPTVSLEEFCSKVDNKEYLKLGKQLVTKNVGKSFSLLSLGLSLTLTKREEYLKLYLKVVESWSDKLVASSRYQDSLKIFEVAHDIYPHSPDLDYLLACTLYRIGKLREAWQYSLKVSNACKNDPKARNLVSALANSLVERWHFPMINDSQRNKMYKDAVEKCVQSGCSSVLDIGAGSALLSIYSKRAGFSQTYACEVDEFMAEMAASVLTLNDADENIVLLNKHSKDLQIPSDISSRVSHVITETFDAGLFGEHILSTLKHAWEHLILPSPSGDSEPSGKAGEPGGHAKVLPSHAQVFVAIIECDYIARQVKLMEEDDIFKDINVYLKLPEPYLSEKLYNVPGKYKLLTKWENVLEVNFNSPENIDELLTGKKDKEIQLLIEKCGRGDGIILAYKLFLDHENCISTFPESETCWENAIYPMFYTFPLVEGTIVNVKMECDGVLHFKLLNPSPKDSSSIQTTAQFLKSANSSSLSNFYRRTAENIFLQNSSLSLTVLDDCPFPKGGMTLIELNPDTSLFLGSESAFTVMSDLNAKVNSPDALNERVDVIFYWPFTPEGTLKENLLEELKSYRKLLTRRGKIYPEYVDIQMLGIDSDVIARMTRVSDANTHGVKVEEVFNILKTDHHLDIAIEGISYNPLTPVLNPARLDLNTCKFLHSGLLLEEECDNFATGFLIVGGELSRSSLVFRSIGEGRIEGFVYWFELSNTKSSLEPDVSSGSDLESIGKSSTFRGKSTKGKDGYETREELMFSSLCRDSPINQCVLLIDKPVNVLNELPLKFTFSMKEEHFSVCIDC